MKRLCLALLLVLSTWQVSQAAWTVDSSLCRVQTFPDINVVTIAVVSDGAAQATELDIWALAPDREQSYLRTGKFVYGIYTAPDATNPPTVIYTLTLTDAFGSTMTLTDQSITEQEDAIIGDTTDTGMYFMANRVIKMTATDAGDSGDTILISFIILK